MRRTLADGEERGDVSLCGRCQDVHIRWENWMLSLSVERFEAFARMVEGARGALGREAGLPAQGAAAPSTLVQ